MPKPEKTAAPDPDEDIDPELYARAYKWACKRQPWCLEQLEDLIVECFEHHGHPDKATKSSDWLGQIRTWVRNHKRFFGDTEGRVNDKRGAARSGSFEEAIEAVERGGEREGRNPAQLDLTIPDDLRYHS